MTGADSGADGWEDEMGLRKCIWWKLVYIAHDATGGYYGDEPPWTWRHPRWAGEINGRIWQYICQGGRGS